MLLFNAPRTQVRRRTRRIDGGPSRARAGVAHDLAGPLNTLVSRNASADGRLTVILLELDDRSLRRDGLRDKLRSALLERTIVAPFESSASLREVRGARRHALLADTAAGLLLALVIPSGPPESWPDWLAIPVQLIICAGLGFGVGLGMNGWGTALGGAAKRRQQAKWALKHGHTEVASGLTAGPRWLIPVVTAGAMTVVVAAAANFATAITLTGVSIAPWRAALSSLFLLGGMLYVAVAAYQGPGPLDHESAMLRDAEEKETRSIHRLLKRAGRELSRVNASGAEAKIQAERIRHLANAELVAADAPEVGASSSPATATGHRLELRLPDVICHDTLGSVAPLLGTAGEPTLEVDKKGINREP